MRNISSIISSMKRRSIFPILYSSSRTRWIWKSPIFRSFCRSDERIGYNCWIRFIFLYLFHVARKILIYGGHLRSTWASTERSRAFTISLCCSGTMLILVLWHFKNVVYINISGSALRKLCSIELLRLKLEFAINWILQIFGSSWSYRKRRMALFSNQPPRNWTVSPTWTVKCWEIKIVLYLFPCLLCIGVMKHNLLFKIEAKYHVRCLELNWSLCRLSIVLS